MTIQKYLGHDVEANNVSRVAHLAHDAADALCCHLNIVAPGQRTRHEIHVRGGLTRIASRAIRAPRHRPTVIAINVQWCGRLCARPKKPWVVCGRHVFVAGKVGGFLEI